MSRDPKSNKRYRVGIIGFAHMHVNSLAAQFSAHPHVALVSCADTRPARPEISAARYSREWNRQHVLDRNGLRSFYDDYHKMLAMENLDIVIVTCENVRHADVVEACAAQGVNVCVEKPMAASLSDGLRMVRACQAASTTMVVNWPLTWSPAVRKARELIGEYAVGSVLEVKWRGGHTGPLGPGVSHPGVSESAESLTGPERAATWWHQDAAGGAR